MEYRVHVGFVPRRPRGLMGGLGLGGGVGWGGIITNVVVALKKSVKRCGCFQEQCSTPRARYGTVQVNTGLIDQMWTDVKKWVPKPISARDHGLLWCYVYRWWLRSSVTNVQERRQKLYKRWAEAKD